MSKTLVPLTSDVLLGPGWPVEQGGLVLSVDPKDSVLWHTVRGRTPPHHVVSAPLPMERRIAESLKRHMTVIAWPDCGRASAPDLAALSNDMRIEVMLMTEAVRRYAQCGDFEAMGRSLDRLWFLERFSQPADLTFDVRYARVRGAGVWGGRPWEGGVVLVGPPNVLNGIGDVLRAV